MKIERDVNMGLINQSILEGFYAIDLSSTKLVDNNL
jgi:hypothetical protein